MINLAKIAVAGPDSLSLAFSDGSAGIWSGAHLIARRTVLTEPLADPAYFARAFIEGGAGLAWPNGLELSAATLHAEMDEAGTLVRKAA